MDPMSGPPGYGVPYSGAPDYGQPPPAKRGVAMPLFAGLTVLFFLVSAVMTGLYVSKSGAYNGKVNDVKAKNAAIATKDGQISDLQKQVAALQGQLDAAGQKQSGTQSQLDEISREKDVIGNCLTLLLEALDAASKGDKATATAKASAADAPCTESQKYLR
jgi:chromosome segregation ATPase